MLQNTEILKQEKNNPFEKKLKSLLYPSSRYSESIKLRRKLQYNLGRYVAEKDHIYEDLTGISARKDGNNRRQAPPYSFDYSELTKDVAAIIESNYTDVNFTIFETRQFNEFMNIQIGKNTIMVSVKSGLENYIFQDLSQAGISG